MKLLIRSLFVKFQIDIKRYALMPLDFPYKGSCSPIEIYLTPGKYLFEAWGAAGGSNNEKYVGKGGYTSSLIKLTKQTRFYAIIGSRGEPPVKSMTNPSGGCGGGGKGGLPYSAEYLAGSGGGGATILYYDTQNLASRIMVSGGGGGGIYSGCTSYPGYAGGVIAGNGGSFQSNLVSQGGSQNFGTENGVGQNGRNSLGGICGAEGNPGCGGGYRGGTTTTATGVNSGVSGSGGSSYVSGDSGCKINPLASFFDTKIYAGNQYFILPDGTKSLGNPGNGHLRISKLIPKPSYPNIYISTKYSFIFIIIVDS